MTGETPSSRPEIDLESLQARTSPDVTVGIGLVPDDPREEAVVSGAGFCPVRAYRDSGALVADLESGRIDAAVRGSFPSSEFLALAKDAFDVRRVRRVALLLSAEGVPFFLGPVGIDEGSTFRQMRLLVEDCGTACRLLDLEPRIAVISAGRPEDEGRGFGIRRSIRKGEKLAAVTGVRHYHITIEEALGWANCIVAPDGVSGNLIYRVLTRLGGGSSLGALYFPLTLRLADTSRGGSTEEYLGAIALANIAATTARSGSG